MTATKATVFGAVSVVGKAQTASDIIPVKIYCSPSMSGLESHLWSPVGRDLVGVGDNLALALRLIDDVMALYGQIGAAEVAARLPQGCRRVGASIPQVEVVQTVTERPLRIARRTPAILCKRMASVQTCPSPSSIFFL